jgi:predicted nucleic acid-binding protein
MASSDPDQIVWWVTATECVSALARRLRQGDIDRAGFDAAIVRLADMRDQWSEVLPHTQLRTDAERLLSIYPLRTADAFQLAAALKAAEGVPSALPFVCFDNRLSEAARSEGFLVEP